MSHRLPAAAILVLCFACTHTGSPEADPLGVPEGLTFPMLLQAGCRNEKCMGGTWAACDSLPVVQAPWRPAQVIAWLTRNEQFEVQDANTVVVVPGVVLVTQDIRQGFFGTEGTEEPFSAGDTLYVLDYRSEGRFNVWHRGGVFRVVAFWPWSGQPGPTGLAEVLRESVSEFWLRVETQSGIRGWVLRDNERILDLHALWPRGRVAGPTDCDAIG